MEILRMHPCSDFPNYENVDHVPFNLIPIVDNIYKTEIIVKSVDFFNGKQELDISCTLKDLSDFFIKTFGWLFNGENILIFMEKMSYKFNTRELHFDENGYRILLFRLLYGLKIAKERYGFRHGDIHSKNIMFDIRNQPKFIDFGESLLNSRRNYVGVESDVFSLINTVIRRAEKVDPNCNISFIEEIDDFDDSKIENLLKKLK